MSAMSGFSGEVILADTLRFEAECRELYQAPEFGSFVRADSGQQTVFGVVYLVATSCIDANRKTQAHWMSSEELGERLPHLHLVLRTTFTARVIGHRSGGALLPRLPGQPPRIHTFVSPAGPEEIRDLTRSNSFLRTLGTAAELPAEDLIGASVERARAAWAGQPDAERRFEEWCRYLARLFRDDFDRFEAIMQRVAPEEPPPYPAWEGPLPLATGNPFE